MDVEETKYERKLDNFFLLRSIDYVVAGVDELVP
jgi:hypothetical protein